MNHEDRLIGTATERRERSSEPPASQHIDDLLDEALDESFPASDPVAISMDRPEVVRPATDSTIPERR